MVQFKKTALAIALTAGMISGAAQAATIDTLFAGTGSSFGMGFFTGNAMIPIFGSSNNIVGAYNPPGWNTNVGNNATQPSAVTSFAFSTNFVNTYTAAAATQVGVPGGGPIPTGTVGGANTTIANGDVIAVNLSSYFANWNGTDFNQGTANALGTVTSVVGNAFAYTLDWTSLIAGGPPFGGQVGTWHFAGTGTVAAVPLPAAVWLLGSGLIGMVGVARRRKSGNTKAA